MLCELSVISVPEGVWPSGQPVSAQNDLSSLRVAVACAAVARPKVSASARGIFLNISMTFFVAAQGNPLIGAPRQERICGVFGNPRKSRQSRRRFAPRALRQAALRAGASYQHMPTRAPKSQTARAMTD